MKTALKITGLFVGILILFSITIGEKPVFSHIYTFISPATNYAQDAVENFFKKSISSTHLYSKRLFDNSVPKIKDSVDSKLSSSKKQVSEPEEKITVEEKAELDQLIKNH